jgi:hypothetical protein
MSRSNVGWNQGFVIKGIWSVKLVSIGVRAMTGL